MDSLIAPLLSFLLLYKYWALFVLTFSAALMLPLPINTVLIATGAFASQGYFSFPLSILTALLGNISGDIVGYTLGNIYGRRILKVFHIHQPVSLQRFERHLQKHSGKTIFFSRFIGALGTLVNILSGFSTVPITAFLWYDLLGNLVSIPGVLCVGYFLGAHWQDFSGLFSTIGWVLFGCVVLILIFWYSYYRWNLRKKNS